MGIINIIITFIGLWLIWAGYQLYTKQNLETLYKESNYEHIKPKYRKDYAKGLGKALFLLGMAFLSGNLMSVIDNKILSYVVEIMIIALGIISIIIIYTINKKYEKDY